jgi:hypothetical protein
MLLGANEFMYQHRVLALPWAARRAIELIFGVGAALFFSYLILQARW